jgi:hypothetical protein
MITLKQRMKQDHQA